MPSPHIFRGELNAMIRSIVASRLDIAGFQFSEEISKDIYDVQLPLRVTNLKSGYYFVVDFGSNQFGYDCYETSSFPDTSNNVEYSGSWDEVIEQLNWWLERVSKELAETDPWLLLNQGKNFADNMPSAFGLEDFDEVEIFGLRELLKDVRAFFRNEVQPTEEQLRGIDEKLSYLGESALRLSKNDWAHMAIGVMFIAAFELALSPDQAQKLLRRTFEFLNSLSAKLIS